MKMKLKKTKNYEEIIIKLIMYASTITVFLALACIIYTITAQGLKALSWGMISKLPSGGFYIGKEGGILNAIVGSVYIVGASTIIGLIISIPIVFYLNIYLRKNSKLAYASRLSFDVLFGIPSIVYGAFGFILMVFLGIRASLLGGIITITLLIIPIFVRSIDEIAREFPHDIIDASYSLGATKFETMKVVIRQLSPGIATATLLSVGRAIGDAAAVMFTAGYTDQIPYSLAQPAATLPLAVFFQLSSPIEEVRARAYAAALILTLIVLIFSLSGRLIMNNFSNNKLK